MLKIRDNVNLNELEKFGLRVPGKYDDYRGLYFFCDDWSAISVEKDRSIIVYGDRDWRDVSNKVLDILFSIIQSGLVEKIDNPELLGGKND